MGHFGSLNWLLWNFPKIFSLDFSDIVPDSSHWKEDQSDCCAFERKILIIPGMEKQVVFGLIINFELFSKYPHYVFLKWHIMPDVKKWPKVTLFGLWRKIRGQASIIVYSNTHSYTHILSKVQKKNFLPLQVQQFSWIINNINQRTLGSV